MQKLLHLYWKPALLALLLVSLAFVLFIEPVNLNPLATSTEPQRQVWVTMRTEQPDQVELVYDTGEVTGPFRWDSAPREAQLITPGVEQRLTFDLPLVRILALRLDLGEQLGEKVITGFGIVTQRGNICQWGADEVMNFLPLFSYEVRDLTLLGDGLHIQAAGSDPHLFSEDMRLETACDARGASAPTNRLLQGLVMGITWAGLTWLFWRLIANGVVASELGLVVGAVSLLCVPGIGMALGLGNGIQTFENRAMRLAPEIPADFNGWLALPKSFEAYFNDHFGWRNEMIVWTNRARAIGLDSSPLDLVLLGKEGWLFYTGVDSMRDYQGLMRLNRQTLEKIDAKQAEVQRLLSEQGKTYIVVVAPDKQSIYPENLPGNIRKVYPETRFDRIYGWIQQHSQIPILDMRGLISSKKQEAVLYHRTDSHWNDLGAYYAYAETMNILAERFPVLAPHPLSDYDISRSTINGFGLAPPISMHTFLTDELVTMTPRFSRRAHPAEVTYRPPNGAIIFAREIDDPSLPTAMIFRDSFGTALIPFFEEHFRRVVIVWNTPRVDFSLIAAEQPDIVIVEVVERKAFALGD